MKVSREVPDNSNDRIESEVIQDEGSRKITKADNSGSKYAGKENGGAECEFSMHMVSVPTRISEGSRAV